MFPYASFRTTAVSCSLACCAFPLAAQQLDTGIDESLVVANRITQSGELLAASTQMIDSDQIRASLSADLAELLALATGVHLTRNGGGGQNASLFLRGTDSDHTLVLVDGQPVNALSDGRARLEFLSPQEIEKVEIVRGARSSLYGSDAIGGVVSVTRKQAADDTFSGEARLLIGPDELRQAGSTLSASRGSWQVNGGLHYREGEGIDARTAYNPDRDGFEQFDLRLGIANQINDHRRVTLNFSHSQSETEFDDSAWVAGGPDGEDEFDRQQIGLRTEQDFGESLNGSLLISKSSEHYTSFGLFGPFRSDSDRRLASGQLNWQATSDARFSLLGEFQQDRFRSNFVASGLDRDNAAITLIGELGQPTRPVTLSLRQDFNEQYGAHLTGQASLGQSTPFGFFWASYGTAFKAPNFFDLYGFGGDPALDPEQSNTAELGWKFDAESWHSRLALFEIQTDNLIEYDNALARIFNSGNVRIQGLEVSAAKTIGSFSITARLDLLDHENLDTGAPLIRRPEQKAAVSFSQTLETWSWSLAGQYSSETTDFGGTPLDGWFTLKASGNWQATSALSLRLQLDNLTDADYQTVAGYNQPGRELRLALDYRF